MSAGVTDLSHTALSLVSNSLGHFLLLQYNTPADIYSSSDTSITVLIQPINILDQSISIIDQSIAIPNQSIATFDRIYPN